MCERLLAHASPLGLYAEELEAGSGSRRRSLTSVLHLISHEEATA